MLSGCTCLVSLHSGVALLCRIQTVAGQVQLYFLTNLLLIGVGVMLIRRVFVVSGPSGVVFTWVTWPGCF